LLKWKRGPILITVFLVLFTLWHYEDIKLFFHSITPIGDKYNNLQQMQDDLNLLNAGKFEIEQIDEIQINKRFIENRRGKDKELLQKYLNVKNSKGLFISFTDRNIILDINRRSREVVTREAINILYFLDQRKIDNNIRFISFSYRPNLGFYAAVGLQQITITLDDFRESLNQHLEKGISTDEALLKLTLKFYENSAN
jgi:hypothetical protein